MLQDRAFLEQMKADILRRAEEMNNEDEEEEVTDDEIYGAGKGKGKAKGIDVAFEDDLDEAGGVKVRDGQSEDEGSEESDAEDDAVCALLC